MYSKYDQFIYLQTDNYQSLIQYIILIILSPASQMLLWLLASITAHLIAVNTASVPVTWSEDSRFICGTFVYVPSGTGLVNETVTVMYNTPLSATPVRLVALGIIDFQFRLPTSAFDFRIINVSNGITSFDFEVYSDVTNNLINLRMSALTIDPSFTSPISIKYLSGFTFGTVGPFSLDYYVNFTASTGDVLNLNNSNAMLAFQHIMHATSASQCFQIDITFQIFNASFYHVNVATNCSMTMTSFGFSRIIFDKTAIEALGYSYFQYGEIIGYNSDTSSLIFTTNPFLVHNFMMGMKSFKISGLNRLQFTTSLGTSTSVSSLSGFTYLSFSYWSLKYRNCPLAYPYYLASTSLCYDSCIAGTYTDIPTSQCLACSPSCTTCSSYSNCTNCDPATHRYQNGTVCPGYYDNGTMVVPCGFSILNCALCTTNGMTCTSCDPGYYPQGSLCLICPNYCNNCSLINSTLTCSQCMLGYSLSNNTCTSVCSDGILVSPEQCDDGNNIDGDGCNADCTIGNNNGCPASTPYKYLNLSIPCASTCAPMYYHITSTYICLACHYTCATCSNNSTCDTCSAAAFRVFNSGQCNPVNGYFDNGTQIAVPCVSPCSSCLSVSVCSSCIPAYNYDPVNQTCFNCSIPNCAVCLNSTTCTNCSGGYWLNSSSLCVPIVCPANCAVCLNSTSCLECNYTNSYFLNNASTCSYCDRNLNMFINMSSLHKQCMDCNTSQCIFPQLMNPQLVSIQRYGCNGLVIKISIQNIVLNRLKISMKIVNTGVQIVDMQQIQTNTYLIFCTYIRDIAEQQLVLYFLPKQQLNITYNPIVPALYYSQNQCTIQNKIDKLLTAYAAMGYFVLFLSLFSHKIVGLQLMGLLQLAFFTLSQLDSYNLYISSLVNFKLFNGFNIPLYTEHHNKSITDRISNMKMQLSFLNNINIMILASYLYFFITSLVQIVLTCCLSHLQKCRIFIIKAKWQGIVMLAMFNACNFAFSATLHFKYFNQDNLMYNISCFLNIGLVSVSVIGIIFIMCQQNQGIFGQFKDSFKDTFVCSLFVESTIIYWIILAAICALNPYAEYTPLILIAISLVFMLYFLINLPYKQVHQNYRSFLINLTILAMMLMANYYTTMKINTPLNIKGRIYTPVIIVLVLIGCCIFVSLLVTVYDLFTKIINYCKLKKVNPSKQRKDNTITSQIFPTLENLNNSDRQ